MSPYNYFPMNYQNNPYLQNYQQQMQQQQSQQQPLNGGYVTVRNEDEARAYPVAPGASVTFFNETAPFCYKKSAGTSPLDPPTFEIYQITKVESAKDTKPIKDMPEQKTEQIDGILSELDVLKRQVSELQKQVNDLMNGKDENNVKSADK